MCSAPSQATIGLLWVANGGICDADEGQIPFQSAAVTNDGWGVSMAGGDGIIRGWWGRTAPASILSPPLLMD